MGMNSKLEMMAGKETAGVEEKILKLFAPSLSGSDVPSRKDWDPWRRRVSAGTRRKWKHFTSIKNPEGGMDHGNDGKTWL